MFKPIGPRKRLHFYTSYTGDPTDRLVLAVFAVQKRVGTTRPSVEAVLAGVLLELRL